MKEVGNGTEVHTYLNYFLQNTIFRKVEEFCLIWGYYVLVLVCMQKMALFATHSYLASFGQILVWTTHQR